MRAAYKEWKAKEDAFDQVLMGLRKRMLTTKTLKRSEVADLFAIMIEYRERYLAQVEKEEDASETQKTKQRAA